METETPPAAGTETPPAAGQESTPPSWSPFKDGTTEFREAAFFEENTPVHLRENGKMLSQFKSLDAFVDSHRELKTKLLERDDGKFRVPGEHSTEEEIAEYKAALGIPDAPEGYDLSGYLEPTEERVGFNQDLLERVGNWAAQEGIPAATLSKMLDFYGGLENEIMANAREEREGVVEKNLAELKEHFGDEYSDRMDLVKAVAERRGFDPSDPVWSTPQVADALSTLAKELNTVLTRAGQEDKIIDPSITQDMRSNEEEANAIESNPSHRLYNDFWGKNGTQAQERAIKERDRLRGY